jgi:hypothetical protein
MHSLTMCMVQLKRKQGTNQGVEQGVDGAAL